MPIGAMVTLRGERMYEFLDRLIAIALPRVRDFKGVSPKGFDGRGNYTLGLRDQLIFPEIDYMKVDKARGMNISVVTTAKTDEEARRAAAADRHAVQDELDMATTAKIAKEKKTPKYDVRAPQPLPAVRPAARLPAQVRAVPPLLPRARARGRRRRRHQEQLVGRGRSARASAARVTQAVSDRR